MSSLKGGLAFQWRESSDHQDLDQILCFLLTSSQFFWNVWLGSVVNLLLDKHIRSCEFKVELGSVMSRGPKNRVWELGCISSVLALLFTRL